MHILILGTRGIPAKHGGFETFAEDLALFLVGCGHEVTVYCQVEPEGNITTDKWRGVNRVLVPGGEGALGTAIFDAKAAWHASQSNGVVLTLGYNTAVLSALYRLRGVPNLMNMDGIEWKRAKWPPLHRAWLWMNEWFGARLANHLVADHPEIRRHLERHTPGKKISTIPYGAHVVESVDQEVVRSFELTPKNYYLVIARPEPENSLLEVVRAYSRRQRGIPLVILGKYEPELNAFHRKVLEAASPEVHFLGAIYDTKVVQALRYYAIAYIHGHQVGGTNPSLVESLGAGNAVIAHDNLFNRWVAGDSARFFKNEDELEAILDSLTQNPEQLQTMEQGSRKRHHDSFMLHDVLAQYEEVLRSWDRG